MNLVKFGRRDGRKWRSWEKKIMGFSRKPLQILHSSFIIHHSSLIISSISTGRIPEKRYSPRWWRHPKDENVSLRAKRSNLFDRDCFVACAPRNDTPSSLMRCHCCSLDRLPLFWNAPSPLLLNSFVLHFFKQLNSY